MASENVELVRSMYAARERGDWSWTDWAHPEVEFVIADGPNPGKWLGLAGMTEGWRSWASAWEGFRSEAEEYRELDDQHVLVLVQIRGRGKTSGLELEHLGAKVASLYEIREGKVTRLVCYFDRDRSLTDLGLKE
jgi:ketosteroid isomerase-like protein